MFEGIIPLGSVVLLKGGSKRVMICGRFQKREGDNHLYDYVGCYYPEGLMNMNELYFFDHQLVQEIHHIGLTDQEDDEFIQYVLSKITAEL